MLKDIHIWIDADSCPAPVRNYIITKANEKNIPVTLAANKAIPCDKNLKYEMIICQQEKDAADNYIFEKAAAKDLVITRDLLFAQKLLQKNVTVINDRGTAFNMEIVNDLLADRAFNMMISKTGVNKKSGSDYNKKQFTKFVNCFDRTLNHLILN